jgi:hypothetical protein
MDWFLSLFTDCFDDVDLVSRIWDNFLLEGEIFAFKVALAIMVFTKLKKINIYFRNIFGLF